MEIKVKNEKKVISIMGSPEKLPKGKAIITFQRSYQIKDKTETENEGFNLLLDDIYEILYTKNNIHTKATAIYDLFIMGVATHKKIKWTRMESEKNVTTPQNKTIINEHRKIL
jgi:hypothetical protein